MAGYPWFYRLGRDTFIAMQGLCLATGRRAEARDILVEWAGAVSKGMLPNRFPDAGDEPWSSMPSTRRSGSSSPPGELVMAKRRASRSVRPIASNSRRGRPRDRLWLRRGHPLGIRMENDGLLAAGSQVCS